MTSSDHQFITGMMILLLLLGPVLIIYWINNMLTPRQPKPFVVAPLPPPLPLRRIMRRKNKYFCPLHVDLLPKNELAVIDNMRCIICTAMKKFP